MAVPLFVPPRVVSIEVASPYNVVFSERREGSNVSPEVGQCHIGASKGRGMVYVVVDVDDRRGAEGSGDVHSHEVVGVSDISLMPVVG